MIVLATAKRSAASAPSSFDEIYRAECPGVPIEYLRALAKRESDTNAAERKGSAWGLLQVHTSLLADYNEVNGTTYTSEDRLDPRINVRIACWLLYRIRTLYGRWHPKTFPGGRFDWTNRAHVEIMTLAWNAGWSNSRGVGAVISWLETRRRPVTLETIIEAAPGVPNVTELLSRTNKIPWVRSVADLYFRARKFAG